MKILFVGDIFGQPGKHVASQFIPEYIKTRGVDLCVVNGENAAGGFGLTENIAGKLISFGVDVITSGNHIFDRQELHAVLPGSPTILRPANYPRGVPGKGYTLVKARNGMKVGVINLQGRIFMAPIDSPFTVADEIVERISSETRIILVDIHAEATSEKMALGYYLDGRVTAVFGTHTHVMTADERILPKGTAYITDAGMTGPHDSIIGVRVEQSLHKIMTQMPVRFTPSESGLRFNAVLVELNPSTGRALAIERIVESVDA